MAALRSLRFEVFLLAATLGACDRDVAGVQCLLRTDCARDEICQDGRCIRTAVARRAPGVTAPPPADAGPPPPRDAGPPPADAGNTGCPEVRIEGGAMFCTISDAIEAASPGAVILVPAGTFAERITLDKRLTIRGRGATGMTVTELSVTGSVPAVQVSAADSKIEFIAVRSPSARAFQIAASTQLRVVAVLAASGAGVAISGASTATITNPTIGGVRAQGATDGAGIVVGSGSRLVLVGGAIGGCDGAGIDIDNARVSVDGTNVAVNGIGLLANGASEIRLRSNARFDRNRGAGIRINDGRIDAQTVTADENGMGATGEGHGLHLAGNARMTVQGCFFRNNRAYGMFCAPTVTLDVCAGNTIAANQGGLTNCVPCN